jgi:hypothetical protein
LIDRLQRVQNSAVRLVKRTTRYESVTLNLKTLHWLPVRYRIEFKIAALTYRCVHGLDHSYLAELVPSRELRSTDSCTLARLRSRLWKVRYINQIHCYYIIIIITVSPRTRCTTPKSKILK